MWGLFKRTVVKIFSLWGIGVYRLNRPQKQKKVTSCWEDPEELKLYLSPGRLKFYDDVVRLMQEKGVDCNGKHISDIGCGSGHLFLSIRKVFHPLSMTGLDYSEPAIRTAQTVVPEAKFHLHDIYDSTKSHKFDVVLCLQTVEHLLFPARACRNLLAMVNRPGILIITVPNGRIDTFNYHINFWSPESWQVFVKDVFNNLDVETGIMEQGGLFAIVRVT